MEPRKQAIIDALRTFMNQRPDLASLGYRDNWAAWRKETREVARDRREALTLLRQIELSDSITADTMIKAADSGGRLTLVPTHNEHGFRYRFDYCAGRSWGHEFRGAAARYLASILWEYTRDKCMPQPRGDGTYEYTRSGRVSAVSAGYWLRAHFRQQFGRGIASRWFS